MTLGRSLGLLILGCLATLGSLALGSLSSRAVPDCGFLVALYLGLYCRQPSGSAISTRDARPDVIAALGGVLGYLADLLGGTPLGLRMLTLSLLVLLLRVLSGHLIVRGTRAILLAALLSLTLYRCLTAFTFALLGWAFGSPVSTAAFVGSLSVIPGELLVTTLAAPLVFWVISRVDRKLWVHPLSHRLGYEAARL